MYSFGRKSINNFLNGGFVTEQLNKGFFKKFNDTSIVVYELNVSYRQYKLLIEKIKEFSKGRKYRYNFYGAVLMPLGIEFVPKGHYTCSHFVAHLLQECGIMKFDKCQSMITPKDFLVKFQTDKSVKATLIYTGAMKSYPY